MLLEESKNLLGDVEDNIDIDKNRYKSIRRKYVRNGNALKYLIQTF